VAVRWPEPPGSRADDLGPTGPALYSRPALGDLEGRHGFARTNPQPARAVGHDRVGADPIVDAWPVGLRALRPRRRQAPEPTAVAGRRRLWRCHGGVVRALGRCLQHQRPGCRPVHHGLVRAHRGLHHARVGAQAPRLFPTGGPAGGGHRLGRPRAASAGESDRGWRSGACSGVAHRPS
jgi:hypothetical protein